MSKTISTRPPNLPALLGPKAPGDVAASAFALFERGVPPDEVVTELMLPVDTAESLWRTWARLRGSVPLSPEAAQALREALCGGRPISDGCDAVAAVKRFVERPSKPCPRCKKAFREYCTTCPAREVARAGGRAPRGSTKKRWGRSHSSELPGAVELKQVPPVGGVLGEAIVDTDTGAALAVAPASSSPFGGSGQ